MAEGKPPACPLCGGAAGRRYQLGHTTLWRCANRDCRLEFAWPQLDDAALEAAYARLYYPSDNGARPQLENTPEWDQRHLLETLERHFGGLAGKRMLDYGCGNGGMMKVAHAMGATAWGIEQSETARESIRRAGFGRAYRDVAALAAAEPAAQFDWIVMVTVIEHLRKPWEEVRQLGRLLAPGGHLVATTPNAACLKSRLRGAGWDQRQNPTHFYLFTPRSLAGVLRRAGLAEVRELPAIVEYSGHGPGRRLAQRVLQGCGMQGGLLFAGRAAAAALAEPA